VAEGGGLLNRYTVKSRIGGSNPPLSAILTKQAQNKGFLYSYSSSGNNQWQHIRPCWNTDCVVKGVRSSIPCRAGVAAMARS
jgi:hypothetical protein